jgi:DNA polymerase III epsilon subunit-like protein
MEILVVDLETAAHDPNKSDLRDLKNSLIIEISIVLTNLETGKIEPVFNHVCREDRACSKDAWIFQNSSLTPEQVHGSSHFNEYKQEIQDLFNQYHATSWWQDYDFRRLEHHSRGLTIEKRFWDPVKALAPFLMLPPIRKTGYKRPKVEEAYKYFMGKRLDHPHRALDDARVEAEIIIKAVKKWPELLEDWQKHL